MSNEDKINELVDLLNYIKEHLDNDCCQTLMDADSISVKIEQTLKAINL